LVGAARGIAHDIDISSLCSVHEGLAAISVDHQFSVFDDLPQLILGISVDMDFHAVNARGQVIPGGSRKYTVQARPDDLEQGASHNGLPYFSHGFKCP